ncbi:MAG TPA: DUF6293 family protein [Methanocorpusculum sp.]|nr:DUF6293 family protein [Methanocorpusculum sp.]HJJ57403.1 DUF6293 family protein [Methanocorpusculum sp.]
MSRITNERVHIIPLGYEFDRAVRPFDDNPAERVYLITEKGADGYAADDYYVTKVADALRSKGIDVEVVTANTFNLRELLRVLSFLTLKEVKMKNSVWVNMSASGKLGAAAATMAGMAHGASVYYVPADRYSSEEERKEHGISVCTSPELILLPKVTIALPSYNEIHALTYLYQENRELSTTEISLEFSGSVVNREDYANDDRLYEEQRKKQSKILMGITNMMKHMEEKNYVSKKKKGRQMMYTIEDAGIDALFLSGKYPPEN